MKQFNFDMKKAQNAVRLLLEAFGEDLTREGIKRTPRRVAEFYKEALSGNLTDPLKLVPLHYKTEDYGGLVLIRDIPFYSLCEHHLLPFFGKAHIAYIPKKDRIIGMSKLVEIFEIFIARLQLQERLTKQVADTIMKSVTPRGVTVVIEAEHTCMTMRGPKSPGSRIVTSVMRGIFLKDSRTRSEAISLLRR